MNNKFLSVLFFLLISVLPGQIFGQASGSKVPMKEWKGIKTFSWQGLDWIAQPLWGTAHPKHQFWYDPTMVSVDKSGNMVLVSRDNEKMLKVDGKSVKRRWATGYCRSVQEFKYGTFEWEAIVPAGTNLWPAVWLSSDFSWPPEIDCMEGWSNNHTDYSKRLLYKNIHPTVHWTENGRHVSETKNNIPRSWIKDGNGFTSYKVVWTPEYVDIFYDGHLVKRFQDKKMLAHLNQENVKMHPVMTMNLQSGFDNGDYNTYVRLKQPFVIKSFKYTPLTIE